MNVISCLIEENFDLIFPITRRVRKLNDAIYKRPVVMAEYLIRAHTLKIGFNELRDRDRKASARQTFAKLAD